MKKFKVLALILTLFFISDPVVKAACSTEESVKLSKEAGNVKASYEILQKDIAKEPNFNVPDGLTPEEAAEYVSMQDYFRIYITNLTENLYVTVYDNITNETRTFSYSDSKDGTISFDVDYYEIYDIRNYVITVYSSINTNCQDQKLYTTYLTTPMYNFYNEDPACNGAEDFYICQKYLSVSLKGINDIFGKIERYKEGKLNNDGEEITEPEKEKDKGFGTFLKENKSVIIAVTVCVVAIGGLVTVIIVKKQRSKRI